MHLLHILCENRKVEGYNLKAASRDLLNFAQYPLSIFPRAFGLALSVAVPVAMVSYIPASALLGRIDLLGLLALPASAVFFVLSLLFWEKMRSKYSGADG